MEAQALTGEMMGLGHLQEEEEVFIDVSRQPYACRTCCGPMGGRNDPANTNACNTSVQVSISLHAISSCNYPYTPTVIQYCYFCAV